MKKKILIICVCVLIVIIAVLLFIKSKEEQQVSFEGDDAQLEEIETVKLGDYADAKLVMNLNLSTLAIEILTEDSFWDIHTDSKIIELSGPFDIYGENDEHQELLVYVKALNEGYAELVLTNYADGKALTLGLDCGLSEDSTNININVISSETEEVTYDEKN